MEHNEFEQLNKQSYSSYRGNLTEKIEFDKYDRNQINKILLKILKDGKNFRVLDDYYLEYINNYQYQLVKPQLDGEKCVLGQIFSSGEKFIFFPYGKLKNFFDDINFLEDDNFELSKDNEKEKLLIYFKKITQGLLLKIKNSN